MDNQELDSERERRFKYAEAVRERMSKLDQERTEKERQHIEEEVGGKKPDSPLLVEKEKGRFSFIKVRHGIFYGFVIGAVLAALAAFIEIGSTVNGIVEFINIWLSVEAVGVLVVAGLIGGALGAFIVGIIVYLLKKITV